MYDEHHHQQIIGEMSPGSISDDSPTEASMQMMDLKSSPHMICAVCDLQPNVAFAFE